MSQQPNNGNEPENTNPAWQEVLDSLPEELQGQIKPKLEAWDRGVQKQLEEARSQYDPYKDIIEQGVDPRYIEGALTLAQQIQSNPEAVIEQANKAFGLNYAKVDPNAGNEPDEDLDDYDGVDISNHPVVKQMAEQLSQLQEGYQTREQREQQEAAQAEYEAQLEELHESKGDFNDLFVTALVSQGASPEEAVQQYQQLVESEVSKIANPQQQQQETPPVVMGGAGTVGSGVPDNPVDYGNMKDGDVMDMVAKIIKNQQDETT